MCSESKWQIKVPKWKKSKNNIKHLYCRLLAGTYLYYSFMSWEFTRNHFAFEELTVIAREKNEKVFIFLVPSDPRKLGYYLLTTCIKADNSLSQNSCNMSFLKECSVPWTTPKCSFLHLNSARDLLSVSFPSHPCLLWLWGGLVQLRICLRCVWNPQIYIEEAAQAKIVHVKSFKNTANY